MKPCGQPVHMMCVRAAHSLSLTTRCCIHFTTHAECRIARRARGTFAGACGRCRIAADDVAVAVRLWFRLYAYRACGTLTGKCRARIRAYVSLTDAP
jgi:hypothetical protein